MIEKNVKDKVKRLIAKYEAQEHVFWSYWPVQTGFGKHGIPDCLICLNGWLVVVETKVDCKEPTARQRYELEQIQRARGTALVIDQHNIGALERVFEALLRGDHLAARQIADYHNTDYTSHV